MIVLQPPQPHSFRQRRIVFMSGLSDPTTCRLSKNQTAFLNRLDTDQDDILWANFPYLINHTAESRQISLLRASWQNGNQFLSARNDPYQQAAQRHWQSLVESCRELVVITLSCGLEILNVVANEDCYPEKLTVIALGPVARQRPLFPHLLVRGRGDWVSLPFFREVDVVLPNVGHMNYLESDQTLELIQSYL